MPYVITVDVGADSPMFYVRHGEFSANVEEGHRYAEHPTGDLQILSALGYAVDYEVVP